MEWEIEDYKTTFDKLSQEERKKYEELFIGLVADDGGNLIFEKERKVISLVPDFETIYGHEFDFHNGEHRAKYSFLYFERFKELFRRALPNKK